jgi:hypothetical protein
MNGRCRVRVGRRSGLSQEGRRIRELLLDPDVSLTGTALSMHTLIESRVVRCRRRPTGVRIDTRSKIEQLSGVQGQKGQQDLLKNLSSGNQSARSLGNHRQRPKFLIASRNLSDYTH